VERGFRTERQQLLNIVLSVVVAAALGAVAVWYRGGLTLPLMAAGIGFMVFYTWPLKYVGLGEVSLLIVWGPLMVGGGYYVLAGQWSWQVVLASLPYALGVTATLMGKHIDKFSLDKDAGVYTLPVILGERGSRFVVLGLFVLSYLIVAWLVVTGFFSPVMSVVVLALPYLFRQVVPMFLKPRPVERPDDYPESAWPLWFVGVSFVYTRKFGGLFVLGLISDTILKRLL
jgi:1,4-dihydroxy-2-naphthoate octaprenyltransferase